MKAAIVGKDEEHCFRHKDDERLKASADTPVKPGGGNWCGVAADSGRRGPKAMSASVAPKPGAQASVPLSRCEALRPGGGEQTFRRYGPGQMLRLPSLLRNLGWF